MKKVYCYRCLYYGSNKYSGVNNYRYWGRCYHPTNYKEIDIKHSGNWAWQHTKDTFRRKARRINCHNNCTLYKDYRK